MKDLTVFQKEGFGVRVVMQGEEPWFVAKDVLEALGYSQESNPSRVIAAVPEEWRGVNRIHTPGGEQEMITISEQGLYFFLGRSDKPAALPYQKWIAGEVMPSIRKTGRYEVPQIPVQEMFPEEIGLRKFKSYKEVAEIFGLQGNAALISANVATRKEVGIDFQERLEIKLITENNERRLIPSDIAEALGMPRSAARKINILLEKRGFQTKNTKGWTPTVQGKPFAVWVDTGKKHGDGTMVQQLQWRESLLDAINVEGNA